MELTPTQRAHAMSVPALFTRDDLLRRGVSARQITAELRAGRLIRLRRDRYARPGLPEPVAEAARIGGRLTCLTLLHLLGIFVMKTTGVHVQVPHNSSRLGRPRGGAHLVHWSIEPDRDLLHVTSLLTAIRHSVRCQPPRSSIATLDSLLHHGLVTMLQLEDLLAELPVRFQSLLHLVDDSAASGPETFVRLMLRTLGVRYETQVWIVGVGYVDFLVNGWLIIECDSKEFHEGWKKQKEDRARDLAAAKLGYVTVRPLAANIPHNSVTVQDSLRQIIRVLGPRFDAPRSQLRKNPSRGRTAEPNQTRKPRFA